MRIGLIILQTLLFKNIRENYLILLEKNPNSLHVLINCMLISDEYYFGISPDTTTSLILDYKKPKLKNGH